MLVILVALASVINAAVVNAVVTAVAVVLVVDFAFALSVA